MDGLIDAFERSKDVLESLIPSPIPVPYVINFAAKKCSEFAISPAFPYRINHIELGDVVLWQALIVILLQPCIWNILGRFEHYTRLLSKTFVKPVIGVYALALWILLAGLYRDALFVAAIESQKKLDSLADPSYQAFGGVLMVVGVVLVLSSFYQLGMTGTFLGDYFGILMDQRITAFPFNYFSDPMYDGSTMIFLSKAILAKSPAGILMSGWVYVVYRIACLFEGPFTAKLYANRALNKKSD